MDGIINESVHLLKQSYKPHPWRWYILATSSLFNLSHGINWLTFAAIFKYAAEYYNVTPIEINYIGIAFSIGAVVGAPFGMFVMDTFSLREALWLGTILNCIGTVIRVLSAYLPMTVPYLGYGVAMLGQFIIALAQPYGLYAPAKVAAVWFPDNERVLANSIVSMSGMMGNGASLLVSSLIVQSTDRLPILLILTAGLALVPLIMTVCGVWRKSPKVPPSPSAEKGLKTWPGVKRLLRNWRFLFMCLVLMIEFGVVNAITVLLPQFMCPFGYSQLYAGIIGGSTIFIGTIGGLFVGYFLDKTKQLEEVSKLSMCLTLLASILVMELFRIPNIKIPLALAYFMFGIFAIIQVPVFIELAIEVTYPVAVATCSGILYSSVQLMAGLFTFLAPYLGTQPDPKYREISECEVATNSTISSRVQGVDYIYFYYFTIGLSIAIVSVYVLGFKPKYNRMAAERMVNREIIETGAIA